MSVYHKHPSAFPLNFIVIGAGGTGSRVVQQLCQLINSLKFLENLNPTMFLIDDDVVEEKNLARQLFAPSDVGKHKAVALVERYSAVYPIMQMHAVVGRVNDRDSLPTYTIGTLIEAGLSPEDALRQVARRTVIIMAVDSMESRRWILASALHLPDPLVLSFIDPGNEDTFGQVTTFSGIAQVKVENTFLKDKIEALPSLCPIEVNTGYIPMPLTHYLLAEDGERTGGCADLDQTLALNSLAASHVIDYVQSMMFNYPIKSHTVRFFLGGEASCSKMDVAWLKRLANGQEFGYTDYSRIADLFTVDASTFNAKIIEDTAAGEYLMSHLKPEYSGKVSEATKFILNALPFVPCFNVLEAEENLKQYNEAKAVKAA